MIVIHLPFCSQIGFYPFYAWLCMIGNDIHSPAALPVASGWVQPMGDPSGRLHSGEKGEAKVFIPLFLPWEISLLPHISCPC